VLLCLLRQDRESGFYDAVCPLNINEIVVVDFAADVFCKLGNDGYFQICHIFDLFACALRVSRPPLHALPLVVTTTPSLAGAAPPHFSSFLAVASARWW
jgi:hypothetical protein